MHKALCIVLGKKKVLNVSMTITSIFINEIYLLHRIFKFFFLTCVLSILGFEKITTILGGGVSPYKKAIVQKFSNKLFFFFEFRTLD